MRTNRSAFYAFVADVEKGEDTAEAFQRHFSMEIATVARSFRLFSIRPSASSTVRIQRAAVPVTIATISAADVLQELAQFLGRINTTRDDAEGYLRAALESDPDHALSVATLGTLRAWDRKFAEAEAYFEEALRIDPDNPAILTAFAEALLQNSIGPFAGVTTLDHDAPARFRRARELIQTALEKETTPIALAILGTTYLTEADPSKGIEPLQKACAARPARLDFALNLYALYLRTEQGDEAEQLFEAVFARTENAQAESAARAVYVREQIDRANRFADLECYDDAADIVKRVIELTPDPAARAELVREVGKLRQVAEVNRQIMTYNEAVAAYNQKELQTAEMVLDGPETATQARQVDLGQAVASSLEELQEEDRLMLLDRLAPLSRAVAENDANGAHEILHAAFLVERAERESFDEAVGLLRSENEERMRLRYVGPQPPYSFLEPMKTGELSWD